jgi:indolepyruvate ferredoxin oxidoreductase beta subunit
VVLGTLAAEAARVIKGYGHVRDKALTDLWIFLDEGLPLLNTLAERGGDVAAAGETALATIAAEAGKGSAGVDSLRKAVAETETAA